MIDKRDLALKIAWHCLNVPYVWGGDDAIAGFDCSGFVVELLKCVGILPHKGDWSADALWRKFKDEGKETFGPRAGILVFWGNDKKMTHIEMCIDDEHCIGASGGGSKTQTLADAIDQNAYIKIRPVSYRGKPKGYINPFL